MPQEAWGSTGIAPLILNFGAGWRWVTNATWYIFNWRLRRPRSRSRRVWLIENLMPPPNHGPSSAWRPAIPTTLPGPPETSRISSTLQIMDDIQLNILITININLYLSVGEHQRGLRRFVQWSWGLEVIGPGMWVVRYYGRSTSFILTCWAFVVMRCLARTDVRPLLQMV